MNVEELNSLRQYAARLAQQLNVDAAVKYDRSLGLLTVEVIAMAGAGPPRAVVQSAKFQSREQAEVLIDQVLRAASTA